MKKNEIEVGKTYLMNHTSGKVNVKITGVVERQFGINGKRRTHWAAINLATKRRIEVKSAMRLLREVPS